MLNRIRGQILPARNSVLLLRLNNPLIEVLGSYAGVFRGARLSFLTTLTPAQPRTTFLSQT